MTDPLRTLADTPPGTMSGQLAKQDLRAEDCIKQWPECESGLYDPRCCRFPKPCSCDSAAISAAFQAATDAVLAAAKEEPSSDT